MIRSYQKADSALFWREYFPKYHLRFIIWSFGGGYGYQHAGLEFFGRGRSSRRFLQSFPLMAK